MRLKRLEIIGFKSFPDKSVIEFPAGISAVVGPNGCGKSNIIDAIKWVMGEQSIKQLRGKSMGDVIFSGTAKRPPLNMAEVSLTLSNDTPQSVSAGLSQLTEIMITRRLYRSGESAYLINKQSCRLKDIHNIFLGSGMGARSCAIVQQGNIGAITDAAPEERRTFIEEAAGVTRYKTRKSEALAKVHSTNQNLLRLNDIVDEIKKQMNTLHRQSKKALQYKEYREGLKKADILVSVYYHELYASEIDQQQMRLSKVKQQLLTRTTELQTLNQAMDQIKSRRVSKNQMIAKKKTQKSDVERKSDSLKRDLKYLRDEEKRLIAEIARLDAAIIDLDAKNRKLNDEIAEESVKSESLSLRIEEHKVALGEKVSENQTARNQLKQFKTRLEDQKKQLMAVMTQKVKFQNIFNNAKTHKENLRQRIARTQKDEAELSEKIIQLKRSLAEAMENIETIGSSSESIRRRMAEQKECLHERTDALGREMKALNRLLNAYNKADSEYAALKKMDDGFEWYKDGVKAIMTRHADAAGAAASGAVDGIIGIAADGLEPEPGFELALEAALGESLQYIVVKDPQSGIASINYLKENNIGRSGFIPLSTFTDKRGEDAPLPSEDAPFLLNHVTLKNGFENFFSELLKDVAFSQDFSSARHLFNENKNFNKTVTKDGDIFYSNGMMVGGSQNNLSGIYKKKLALKQLKRQLTDLNKALESTQKRQHRLEDHVNALESNIQALTRQKQQMEKEMADAEKKHFQASESLKHTQRHYDIISLEREKLMGEKSDIEEEMSQHHAALAQVSEKEQSLEQEIKTLTRDISTLSDQVDTLNRTEMDLKLSLTRLKAERENTDKSLQRLKKFQAEGRGSAEQVKQDILIKKEKNKQAGLQIIDTDQTLADTMNQLSRIDSELQGDHSEFQHIINEVKEKEDHIHQCEKMLDEDRQKQHQLELEISGLKIKRENVLNRFLENYSHDFSESLAEWKGFVTSESFSIKKTESDLAGFKKKLDQMANVNLGAIDAYEAQKNRYAFLVQQRDDLVAAIEDLQRVIKKINRITQKLFIEMFHNINEQFKSMFPRLFAGGSAWLELTQPNNPQESGVELMIHPPGKKVTRLSLLSGGEKALSAIAFIFSIFLINPSSYCLLDEIDAPLDEANTQRFNELLKIIGEKSQIIMISHNKRSMEFSDMLFGVTMGENGVSRLVSVDIEKLSGRSFSRH